MANNQIKTTVSDMHAALTMMSSFGRMKPRKSTTCAASLHVPRHHQRRAAMAKAAARTSRWGQYQQGKE